MRRLFLGCVIALVATVSIPVRAELYVGHEDFELWALGANTATTLRPTATHVCFLAGFMGNSGGGRVLADQKTGKWMLHAFRGYSGARVRARCVQAALGRSADSAELISPLISPNFVAAVTSALCTSAATPMWEADTVSILQGFDGRLDQTTDAARITTPPSALLFPGALPIVSTLRASSCNHTAYGNSVDLFPSGAAILSDEYAIEAAPPNDYTTPARVAMTTSHNSFCYFTRVSGDFREFSQIDIVKLDGRWQLQAKTEAAPYNGTIAAKARCVIGIGKS